MLPKADTRLGVNVWKLLGFAQYIDLLAQLPFLQSELLVPLVTV
jgi:hypothetical protein